MVDLSEFLGDSPLRASLAKKRQKEQERLAKLEEKCAPIRADIDMYNKMLSALDEREALSTLAQETHVDDDNYVEMKKPPEIENQ